MNTESVQRVIDAITGRLKQLDHYQYTRKQVIKIVSELDASGIARSITVAENIERRFPSHPKKRKRVIDQAGT